MTIEVVKTEIRLLAAEDDALGQRLLQVFLRDRLGYALDLVDNGIDALAAVERLHYDTVLLDLEMPRMGGMAVVQDIRKRENARGGVHLGVIALTGHVGLAAQQACLDGGFDGYVSKPIRLVNLQSELDRVLTLCVKPLQKSAQAEPSAREIADGVWAMLEPVGVDADTMDMLVRMFKEHHVKDVAELRQGVEQHQAEQVRLSAHKLKGSLGTLGIQPLAAIMQEMEQRASRCDSESGFAMLASLFEPFVRQLAEFNARLDIWLESRRG